LRLPAGGWATARLAAIQRGDRVAAVGETAMKIQA